MHLVCVFICSTSIETGASLGVGLLIAIASFVSFVLTSQITMIKTQRCRDLEEVDPSNLILEGMTLVEEQQAKIPGLNKLKELVSI